MKDVGRPNQIFMARSRDDPELLFSVFEILGEDILRHLDSESRQVAVFDSMTVLPTIRSTSGFNYETNCKRIAQLVTNFIHSLHDCGLNAHQRQSCLTSITIAHGLTVSS